MERRHRSKASGFTIVELMVAMLLGLLLGGAILTTYVSNRNSFNRDESIGRMQDGARQAVRDIVNDLSMAGFWADLVLPSAIFADASLGVGTDCGPAGVVNWVYRVVTPGTGDSLAVAAVDNATGATANASFSCIAAGEIVPGTDIVAIKRLAGARAPAVLAADTVYLRTNGTFGLLYREPAAVPPAVEIPVPFSEWEYRPSIYYVRNFAVTAGDGIPTLCRKVLQYGALPTMITECLAQGIEDLQVEFGLDADGDGEPNVYVADPTIAEMQTAVSARIFVLARSVERDLQYTNDKTYRLSNAPAYAPADNFLRRVFSVTVGLRNMSSLRTLRS
jgi:type IV pilus assembly protein PilW